jgi:hypothetical protein
MSLQDLPTELDLRILDHLEGSDLSRMTRVNKYYRRVGEPLLYHSIKLYSHQDDRLKLLLVTARLSRVSKYYRRLSEPHIYNPIELYGHKCNRIKRLLLTLIRRKDLRQMIQTITLRQHRQLDNLDELPRPATFIQLQEDHEGEEIY